MAKYYGTEPLDRVNVVDPNDDDELGACYVISPIKSRVTFKPQNKLAYLILCTNQMTCLCPIRPPSLPPSLPSPPADPPSLPSPPSHPPTAPLPPHAPITCENMGLRENVWSTRGKWCYELSVGIESGCEGYFTQNTNSGMSRFCYNPNHPTIIPGTKCASTDAVECFKPPPRPPAGPPPASPPAMPINAHFCTAEDLLDTSGPHTTFAFCRQMQELYWPAGNGPAVHHANTQVPTDDDNVRCFAEYQTVGSNAFAVVRYEFPITYVNFRDKCQLHANQGTSECLCHAKPPPSLPPTPPPPSPPPPSPPPPYSPHTLGLTLFGVNAKLDRCYDAGLDEDGQCNSIITQTACETLATVAGATLNVVTSNVPQGCSQSIVDGTPLNMWNYRAGASTTPCNLADDYFQCYCAGDPLGGVEATVGENPEAGYTGYDCAQTHTNAKTLCEDAGGRLATPRNKAEYDELVALLAEYPDAANKGAWLGLTNYDEEDVWKSDWGEFGGYTAKPRYPGLSRTTGATCASKEDATDCGPSVDILFHAWASNSEPVKASNKKCASQSRTGGTWQSRACESKGQRRPFVCKAIQSPPPPPSPPPPYSPTHGYVLAGIAAPADECFGVAISGSTKQCVHPLYDSVKCQALADAQGKQLAFVGSAPANAPTGCSQIIGVDGTPGDFVFVQESTATNPDVHCEMEPDIWKC